MMIDDSGDARDLAISGASLVVQCAGIIGRNPEHSSSGRIKHGQYDGIPLGHTYDSSM